MSKPDIHLVDADHEIERQFRLVMRRLPGGVCIITAGQGEEVTGMTVTSLTSLSASPPRLLVSINRQASSFAPIARHRLNGRERFEGTDWTHGASGVPLLQRSLAMIECQVEEIIERHSHGIIVGRLASMELSHRLSGLTYWNGQYVQIDHEADLDLLAEVSIPLAHVR